ncbi:MAG: HvfC/BufC family peptide modification chaperone, partial [Burkholderiales bacterium]
MNELREIQQDFAAYLRSNVDAVVGSITDSATVPAAQRLAIYHNAYRARLVEALQADFPALCAYLGDAQFEQLGHGFIDTHPSRHFSLRWFGARLADFLRANPPYREHPCLAELAQFEWAMTLCFDACDDPVVSVEQVAALPPDHWPDMRLLPHASLRRMDVFWSVTALR